jgi:hypothetical protein
MAVAIVMDFPGGTLDQYDAVIARMGFEPGGSPPEGAMFHFVVKTDDGVRVTDVWETMEQFDAFAKEHIGPHSQAVGIPGPPVTTMYEVHNYFA